MSDPIVHPRSDAPVRLAIVGCGAVTEHYHLPAILSSDAVQLVAVVDPALERARALARRAPGAEAVASHEQLDAQVEAVIVATPNVLHAPIAVALLERGIHVLVEKPMARTVAECDAMIAASWRSRAVLAVGHDFRHFPAAGYAHELLHAGTLGAVRDVVVRQNAGARWPSVSTAVLSAESGGGLLMDFGVHLFDLLLWWLGEMTVDDYCDDAQGGVESEAEAAFRLAGGAPLSFEISRLRTLSDSTRIRCELGDIEVAIFDPAFVRLRLPGVRQVLHGAVPDATFDRAPMRAVFLRQLDDFVAAVRGLPSAIVTGREGRQAVALVESCYARRTLLRHPWDYPEAYAGIGGTGSRIAPEST